MFAKRLFKILLKPVLFFLNNNIFGKKIRSYFLKSIFENKFLIKSKGINMVFTNPNDWTNARANSFFEKEPETIEWINNLPKDIVLWDIGANVGNYSIYAAKINKKNKIFAFEPSVFNVEILVRNINLNNLESQITLIPFPLSNNSENTFFNLSSMEWGASMSSFGKEAMGFDGRLMKVNTRYQTVSFSMDQLIYQNKFQIPNAIKIDVDGIEHKILNGGIKLLKEKKLNTILIEVNDNFKEQKENVEKTLKNSGFSLNSKNQSNFMKKSNINKNTNCTNNQIWSKI